MDTTRQFASQIGVGFQEQAHSNVYGDSEAHSFKLYREKQLNVRTIDKICRYL